MQIIMFLITACTTLCVTCSTALLLGTLVDEQHRIRSDRISKSPSVFAVVAKALQSIAFRAWLGLRSNTNRGRYSRLSSSG